LRAPFTIKQRLRSLFDWGLGVTRFFLRKNFRFLPITPPFLSTQIFYDSHSRHMLRVKVRDRIDWITTVQVFYDNDYSFETLRRRDELQKYYDGLVSSGVTPLIIDCGGNIGLATKFFAETYPKAKIVCIEPDSANIAQARINNSNGDVVFLEAAIGGSDSRGDIIDPGLGNNAFRVTDSGGGDLRIISMNTVLRDNALGNTGKFIAKIDIEGFEQDLFSKNTEWIDEFPLLIVELHDWLLPRAGTSLSFLREISKLDRDFVCLGENVFSISNKIPAG